MRSPVSLRLTAAAAVAALTLTVVPAQAAPPDAGVLLSCDEVGTLEARLGLRPGTSPTLTLTDSGAVRLKDGVGFGGVVTGTATPVDRPAPTGLACATGELTGPAGELLGVLPPGLSASTSVTGRLLVALEVDTEAILAAAGASPAGVWTAAAIGDPAGYGPEAAFGYESVLRGYLAGRSGNAAVAYRRAGTSTIYSYSKGATHYLTASVIKASIMATVLRRAQEQGRGLTAWETSQLVPMIRQSSNEAGTALWNYVGGGPEVARVWRLMGLRSSTPGPDGKWGLSVTTAADQVVLQDHYARANPVLDAGMRSYALSLLRGASSWGITAGPGYGVAVKNGWLPYEGDWHVNSTGSVPFGTHLYTIAILTRAPTSLDTQKATIEGTSRIVYSRPLGDAPTPIVPSVTQGRGDWDRDGYGDALMTQDNRLYRFVGHRGRLYSPEVFGGPGWATMTWIGSPGDVNADGYQDLLARDLAGDLFVYYGTVTGRLGARAQIGRRWGGLTIITAGDFERDGRADLLARTATGDLLWYQLPRTGWAQGGRVVGQRWGAMSHLVAHPDFTGDGRTDVLGVRDGVLYAYASTGTGLRALGQVGHGWRPKFLTAPSDLDGDTRADVVMIDLAGRLWSYPVGIGARLGAATAHTASGTAVALLA